MFSASGATDTHTSSSMKLIGNISKRRWKWAIRRVIRQLAVAKMTETLRLREKRASFPMEFNNSQQLLSRAAAGGERSGNTSFDFTSFEEQVIHNTRTAQAMNRDDSFGSFTRKESADEGITKSASLASSKSSHPPNASATHKLLAPIEGDKPSSSSAAHSTSITATKRNLASRASADSKPLPRSVSLSDSVSYTSSGSGSNAVNSSSNSGSSSSSKRNVSYSAVRMKQLQASVEGSIEQETEREGGEREREEEVDIFQPVVGAPSKAKGAHGSALVAVSSSSFSSRARRNSHGAGSDSDSEQRHPSTHTSANNHHSQNTSAASTSSGKHASSKGRVSPFAGSSEGPIEGKEGSSAAVATTRVRRERNTQVSALPPKAGLTPLSRVSSL